ncbi:MAG: potassium channel family protein, partial [Rhodospirillales bacterium]|nr:potassium channel family protein [Rhodospirillales bacterium]
IEYAFRVWSATESPDPRFRAPVIGRLRYMISPMAVIDLVAILPFYLAFFVDADLRILRVLRLLRIFKLTRYASSISLLSQVLKEESRSIGVAMFLLLLLLVIAASFTYLAEQHAQPEAFGSIPAAIWWAVITMTTVGYGDVVPVTVLGKILGAILGVIGVGMVALPAGLLASGFMGAVRRRRIEYEGEVAKALKDGVLTHDEMRVLARSRATLGLGDDEAETVLQDVANSIRERVGVCPHCGKALHERRAEPRGAEQAPGERRRGRRAVDRGEAEATTGNARYFRRDSDLDGDDGGPQTSS